MVKRSMQSSVRAAKRPHVPILILLLVFGQTHRVRLRPERQVTCWPKDGNDQREINRGALRPAADDRFGRG